MTIARLKRKKFKFIFSCTKALLLMKDQRSEYLMENKMFFMSPFVMAVNEFSLLFILVTLPIDLLNSIIIYLFFTYKIKQ